MEIDTGSALSVISATDYNRLFSKIPLQKTTVMLKTHTVEKVSHLGKMKVHFTKAKHSSLTYYKMEDQHSCQLDRHTIKALH